MKCDRLVMNQLKHRQTNPTGFDPERPDSPPEPVYTWDPLHHKLTSLVSDLIANHIDLQFAKKELETAYIREILKANKGNIGMSAKVLGIHRNTLSKRLKELDIPVSKSQYR